MNIIVKQIDDLILADYNPRVDLQPGDPEYEKLRRSMQEFDYIDPIIWNQRTGRVVGGHQRLKVLKDLGWTEVEVSVVDLPEDKEKALNIALNKISGEWDMPRLKNLLEELNTGAFDIELTGFSIDELKDFMVEIEEPAEIQEDDFDADSAAESIKLAATLPGDIWELGSHRLMCGDATVLSDVEKLMAGKLAKGIFTDPPYNVDYTGGTKDALKIRNDNMSEGNFYKFLYAAFFNMYKVTEPGSAIYVCHADSEGLTFRKAMLDAGWLHKLCIIWAKNSIVMGRQDYHWQHEPILYGWKPGSAHNWYGGRKESTVWNFNKPLRNAEHPTMKPIGIPARAIQNSTKKGEIVLDLFGGSGSTMLAAEQTERVCYMMELDPVYCGVIVMRWEQFTGEKAKKISI